MPQKGEQIKTQKPIKTIDYPLMKKAVYYVSRLISGQKENEFHDDDYNGLKKVYSIWVCMNIQNYKADSIQEYGLNEKISREFSRQTSKLRFNKNYHFEFRKFRKERHESQIAESLKLAMDALKFLADEQKNIFR